MHSRRGVVFYYCILLQQPQMTPNTTLLGYGNLNYTVRKAGGINKNVGLSKLWYEYSHQNLHCRITQGLVTFMLLGFFIGLSLMVVGFMIVGLNNTMFL